MTDAILPGYTSPGTIKGSINQARTLFLPLFLPAARWELSFPFPPCWQQGDMMENISLSIPGRFQQQTRTFPHERAHFNICSSASFRRLFPCQSFLPLKPNGPQSIWLSTKFPHSHLQLSCYLLRLMAQGKTSPQVVIKLQNLKPSISKPSLFYILSYNITRAIRTLQCQLPFMFKW